MSSGFNVLSLIDIDENEEDNESRQRQALFVPEIEEGEDLSGPPMDGHQYLQRVVEERKRCDAIVAKKVEFIPKKNSKNQMLQFPDDQRSCSSEFYMDKKTQMRMVSDFCKLRRKYEARRGKIPLEKMKKLRKVLPRTSNKDGWLKIFSTSLPNLAETLAVPYSSIELCLAIPQEYIWQVMEYVEDWITEGELSVPNICQWVHMLLACVNLPMEPDMCAAMRAVVKALIVRRSQLENPASEELPHINLIICIVGRYFIQLDLADPME